MKVTTLQGTRAFTTLDGSEIRELAGVPTGNALNQSLAEATLPPGGETQEHYHRESEEIYYLTHGRGRLRVGAEEREVAPGDAVVIDRPGYLGAIQAFRAAGARLVGGCCRVGTGDITALRATLAR